MKKILALIFASFLLVGCAGGPKADKAADLQAKQFIKPTNGTSNLYIYRNELFGGAINMDVYVDNQRITTTGPKTYIVKNLPAGEHKIEGKGFEGTSILKLNMLPNTIHYVWQEVKMGFIGARNRLHEVSEQQGKKGVMESKLLDY